MIPDFKAPRRDEPIYSAIARHKMAANLRNSRAVVQEFFGSGNVIAVIDFPSRLEHLVANLSPGHLFTSDRLIDEHSLLPFYVPFLPPERVAQLRENMKGDGGSQIHMRLGVMASSIPLPTYLRYCPKCVKADRAKFPDGCYWRRVHQLAGVLICPDHAVPLQDSLINPHTMQTRYNFVTAESVIPEDTVDSLNPLIQRYFNTLYKIACDAAWLLEQRQLSPGLDNLQQRYLYLLAERGVATYSYRVRAETLLAEFLNLYPPDLLSLLNCPLDVNSSDNWLLRLVRKPDGGQHPLFHLLLIQFLNHSAESFFATPTQARYFGEESWPCLNTICDYFRQLVIKTCEAGYSYENHCPVGIFVCDYCGFAYSRSGPDKSVEDAYKRTQIVAFGPIWEAKLINLWADPGMSLRGLADHLGVDAHTVKRQASRLNLPFPRPGGNENSKRMQLKTSFEGKDSTIETSPTQEKHRREWLEAIQMNLEANLTEIRQQVPASYSWLYRNDRGWLNKNRPQVKGERRVVSRQVNWSLRDLQIAILCIRSVLDLTKQEDRPKQITKTSIARHCGQHGVIFMHPEKLPISNSLLSHLAETREEFAIRRIWWTVKKFLKEGISVERWQLIRVAGIGRVANWPIVHDQIDRALLWLIGEQSEEATRSMNPPKRDEFTQSGLIALLQPLAQTASQGREAS